MGTGQRISGVARLGAVLALAGGVVLLGEGGAHAAPQVVPDPVGAVVGTATSLVPAPPPSGPTTPVTQVVGAVKGAVESPSGKGSGSAPQRSTPARTAPGTSASARVVAAPAADGDTVVGADLTVRDLLGACVRLTRAGVPARTTIVVLDRNLLDELRSVGLPVERLLVPCPAGASVGTSQGSTGGTTSAAATSANPTGSAARVGASGLLAFTGADLAPTVLLASGLIALGIAFLRKAHGLVDYGAAGTNNA